MSTEEFINQFKNSFIREIFSAIIPAGHLGFFMMQLATFSNHDACWPIGGSLEFSKKIAQRYNDLGGKIYYNSKVKNIIVEDNRAVGIILENGNIVKGDYIISAADGYSTVFNLLEGKFIDNNIINLYQESNVIPSSIQISFGVNYDLSSEPDFIRLKLLKPLVCGNKKLEFINIRHYCYDKTLCATGKSVVTILLESDYNYWKKLRNNKEIYDREKENISQEVLSIFEARFPEAKGKVEIIDIATPYTFYRYTDSWQGGFMGWNSQNQKIPKVLPGLKGLYLAGQWTSMTAGLPTALLTGYGSIKRICADNSD